MLLLLLLLLLPLLLLLLPLLLLLLLILLLLLLPLLRCYCHHCLKFYDNFFLNIFAFYRCRVTKLQRLRKFGDLGDNIPFSSISFRPPPTHQPTPCPAYLASRIQRCLALSHHIARSISKSIFHAFSCQVKSSQVDQCRDGDLAFFAPLNASQLMVHWRADCRAGWDLSCVGLVYCGSARMEDIPAADTFSVEDMMSVSQSVTSHMIGDIQGLSCRPIITSNFIAQ